ncbi:MAG: multidrug effflux MFS transporter [Pseudomonadota bacterium]
MTLPNPEDRAAGRAPLAFLLFLALMTSVVAFTIDAVLPALDAISDDLAFRDPNDRQLIVMIVFLGMGLSQPLFGPLADSIGRKRASLVGWGIFLVGSALCGVASNPEAMLAGRFLQGFGAGGPRIIAVAVVRDLYTGRPMARILSIVLTIFMLVPMLAPLVGQWIELWGGWRMIFVFYGAMAAVAALWYGIGVPETLAPEAKRPLTLRPVAQGFAEVLSNRKAMAYTASAACVFGPFLTYLATAQQVLEELYDLGTLFPAAFGLLAIAFAGASFANSRLVMALGMRRLALIGLVSLFLVSLGGALLMVLVTGGQPPLWVFMTLMALVFTCIAILFANFNTLALEPLGHVAGTASAVVMSLSSLGAMPVGLLIAQSYNGSLLPMFGGFALMAAIGLGCFRLAESPIARPQP